MPIPLLSHQAPLLPLKMAWPRYFDGTALVVGSMAPDLADSFGPWLAFQGHEPLAQLWWSLPVTLIVATIIPSVTEGRPDDSDR